MPKLIRITTVPMALRYLLPGQMKYMKEHGFDVIMISADGREREEVIATEGCAHIIVPMTRKITPFKDLRCLWKLVKIFKKEKPDIVHTHTPKAGLLGMLAAKISGVNIRIHTVAGLPLMVEKGFKFRLLTVIEKVTYRAANYVWPNSYSLFNYIKQHRLTKEEKLKVIRKGSSNGIDTDRFNLQHLNDNILNEIKENIGYTRDNIYLLSIGRLVKDKGITELTAAFVSLQEKYPNLKLILAGKFEEELDPLPRTVKEEIKTNPGIIHVEWTTQPEYYFPVADFFIFPSHREGFPNVLLQAAAMKIPVICSAIAGNVDIITDHETGLRFPSGDAAGINDKIIFALDNRTQMKTMAEKLYQDVTTSFRRESVWNSIFAEYNNLIKQNEST